MECVIIAIPKRETAERVADVIRKRGLELNLVLHRSASGILSETQFNDSGIVICAERIQDMSYTELFDYLPGGFRMIVISRNTNLESSNPRVRFLVSPFRIPQLMNLLTDFLGTGKKTERKKKPIRIERTPEEQRMIDQAKEILMKSHGVSEPEAHRMLQKQSMDYGRSLVESAQMLLLLNGEW